MARIAIAGFMHETNCFVPDTTDFENFANPPDRSGILRGEEILQTFAEKGASTAGFLNGSENNHEIAPLLWTSTTPGGYVTKNAYERIAGEIIARLSEELPVDAVYLDLHGAMVSEEFEDGEGELLRRVRAVVGEDAPIVISLDYHANVSAQMVQHADAILPYWTYPHGISSTPASGRQPRCKDCLWTDGPKDGPFGTSLPAAAELPMHFGGTFERDREAAAARLSDNMLSLAYLAGFPPGDLRECGPTVSAHAYSQEEANAAVDEIAQLIALKEAEFAEPLLPPDDAVKEAMRIAAGAAKPVVIADTGQSGLRWHRGHGRDVEALVQNNAQNAIFGVVKDPTSRLWRTEPASEPSSKSTLVGKRISPA